MITLFLCRSNKHTLHHLKVASKRVRAPAPVVRRQTIRAGSAPSGLVGLATCGGAVAAACVGSASWSSSEPRPGYMEVPTAAIAAAAVAAAGMVVARCMPLTGEAQVAMEKDLSSMSAVAAALKRSTDAVSSSFVRGPTIPLIEGLKTLTLMAEAWVTKNTDDPELQTRELVRTGDVRDVTRAELDTLDCYLPLACAAYEADARTLVEELAKQDLQLLYQDQVTDGVERTSHFVAQSAERKEVVIAIRGTANLDDALTDAICRAVPLNAQRRAALSHSGGSGGGSDKGSEVFVHEAMASAAHYLKDRLGPMLRDGFATAGYDVVVTGHSLGAGTAVLLAMLLKEELGIDRVRGIGFATPPVCSENGSLGCKDYVTSVVHHADVFPRASLRNLAIMAATLDGVNNVRKRDGADAARDQTPAIAVAAARKHDKSADDLLVPGEIVYLYSDGNAKYHGAVADGTLPVFGTIIAAPTLLTDHLCVGYMHALKAVRGKQL